MKQDLDKIEEIRLDAEKLFERLSMTVQSIASNYMDLKTLLLEKEVIDYKLEATDKEHEIKNKRFFSDFIHDELKNPGQHFPEYPTYEISADINSRFASLIAGIFGNEYFDALSVFHYHFQYVQDQMNTTLNIVSGSEYGFSDINGVFDDYAPDKSYATRFELLRNSYLSMRGTLKIISEAEIWFLNYSHSILLDPEEPDIPSARIWHDAQHNLLDGDSSFMKRLKRLGRACIDLKKENVKNSENLDYWIKISGVKEGKNKRRNPKRNSEFVGLVMKDAIKMALEDRGSLSPKELSENIFTEEAVKTEGVRIDKNIAAVLSREKDRMFESEGNGKWRVRRHIL